MIKVKITYFATLKQQRGLSEEVCEIPPMSVRELYHSLSDQHGFITAPRFILYSVNNEFVDQNTFISDNDHVVFVPPVSGG